MTTRKMTTVLVQLFLANFVQKKKAKHTRVHVRIFSQAFDITTLSIMAIISIMVDFKNAFLTTIEIIISIVIVISIEVVC